MTSWLFLASSPRHALLAAGAALAEPAVDSHLYVIEHLPRPSVTTWLEVLGGWEASPFRSLTRLAGDWRAEAPEGRGLARLAWKRATLARYRRANRRALARDVERLAPSAVWVGTDTYLEAQWALARAKRRDPAARGAYLEDGTAAYARTFRESRASRLFALRRLRDAARRARYGSFWRPAPVPGTSPWIDEAWLAFPELAVAELAGKELRALAPEPFRGAAFRSLAERAARALGADPARLAETSLVLALTRSTVAKRLPRYAESVRELVRELTASGRRVAVKHHPREGDPDFLPLRGIEGVDVVPAALPLELLLLLSRAPELAVVADVSTALLAARWLRPDARVVALRTAPSGTEAGEYLRRELAALGVPVVDEPRGVRAALARI